MLAGTDQMYWKTLNKNVPTEINNGFYLKKLHHRSYNGAISEIRKVNISGNTTRLLLLEQESIAKTLS